MMKVDVSLGEVVDKITILELKKQHLSNSKAVENVEKELVMLLASLKKSPYKSILDDPMMDELRSVNRRLWDIEDQIRLAEQSGDFDQSFVSLARSVYIENDRRARVKRNINVGYSSGLIEEKSYVKSEETN